MVRRWWRLRLPDDHGGVHVDIDLLDYRATNDDLHAAAYVVAYDVDVPRLRAEHAGQHDDYRDGIEHHDDNVADDLNHVLDVLDVALGDDYVLVRRADYDNLAAAIEQFDGPGLIDAYDVVRTAHILVDHVKHHDDAARDD